MRVIQRSDMIVMRGSLLAKGQFAMARKVFVREK
jgi:hypothetical protein